MSGVNAGVSASYGQENSTMGQNTASQGTSSSATDFNTALRELSNTNSMQSTALPQYARLGARQSYQSDLAANQLGKDFLASLLSDPYNGGGGRFAPAIDNMFAQQLSQARTGDTSMAGTARQGFREGEALAQAQNQLLGLGTNAALGLLQNSNPNQSLSLIGSFAPKMTQTRSARDQSNIGTSNTNTAQQNKSNTTGFQDSSNWGVGGSLGCCFIFLEAYNGVLPWYVRRCRDEFTTGPRRRGYNLLAAHLVPRMQRSKWVRRFVNWFMVKPMTSFGGWLYSEPKHRFGWMFGPITAIWFAIFGSIGNKLKD